MSEKIKITFPDKSIKEFEKGISAYDIAASISKRLADDILVAEVNGKMKDLSAPINEDANIVLHKFDSDKGKEVYWHTTSHMMAQAIEELYPGAKFGVGPAIEGGFYYDIDSEKKFTEEDLKKIEDKMLEISKRDLKPLRQDLKRDEAIEYFKNKRKISVLASSNNINASGFSMDEEDLFTTVRCRKLAVELGFEKMLLKNDTLKCFFVGNPESPYFQSDTFNSILQCFTNQSR